MADSSFSSSSGDVKGLLSLGCIVLQPWKIESSCKNPDNSWSYLVRWRDVWLHENICSKFSNLIDEYWLEHGNKRGKLVVPEAEESTLKVETDKSNDDAEEVGDFQTDVEEGHIETENDETFQGEIENQNIESDLAEVLESSENKDIDSYSAEVLETCDNQNIEDYSAEVLESPSTEQECDQLENIASTNDDSTKESLSDSSLSSQSTILVNDIVKDTNILTVSESQSMETYPAEALKPPTTKPTYVKKIAIGGKTSKHNESTKESPNVLSRKVTSVALQRAMPQLVNNVVKDTINILSMKTQPRKNSEKKIQVSSYRKSGPRRCEICDKILSSQNALREHRIMVHLKNGRFPCTVQGCDKRYSQRRALRLHMVSHTNERNFVCEKCGSTHKRPRELKLHMIDMHSETQIYRCDVCFKCFKEKGQLKHHCFTDHKDTVTECIVCKQQLSTPFSIYSHCLKHADVREFECDICHREYKTAKALADHEKIHDPDRKPFRNCPKCGKAIFSRSHFYEHVNSHDSNSNEVIKFTCDICGSKFQHSSSLKRHSLRHRPGGDLERPKVNPYLTMDESLLPSLCCRICRRNYTSKSGYYDHIKRCRDGVVTTVNCALCDKTYAKRSALNRHLRLHHPDMLVQIFDGSATDDTVTMEIEPTTVEVLNVGESNEVDDQSDVHHVQFHVALAPDSVDVIETEVETADNETTA